MKDRESLSVEELMCFLKKQSFLALNPPHASDSRSDSLRLFMGSSVYLILLCS